MDDNKDMKFVKRKRNPLVFNLEDNKISLKLVEKESRFKVKTYLNLLCLIKLTKVVSTILLMQHTQFY